MTPKATLYTAVIYECGYIDESDITTGHTPPHFCPECYSPSMRYFAESDHNILMKTISAYCDGNEMVGTDYSHRHQ